MLHLSSVDRPGNGVPAAILKGGQARQHLVPLSEQALQLLNGLLVDGKPAFEWVFPARNRRGHLGTSAMLDLLGRTGWGDRDHPRHPRRLQDLGDRADQLAREVVELCLSHVRADPLERAYPARRYPRKAAPADAGLGRLLQQRRADRRKRGAVEGLTAQRLRLPTQTRLDWSGPTLHCL